MKVRIVSKMILSVVLLVIGSTSAFALVQSPRMSIQNYTLDTGAVGNNGLFTIDGTALSITLPSLSLLTINEDFQLSASYSGTVGTTYNYTNGSLAIGSLLQATFNNMAIDSVSGSNFTSFSADLLYTGGTMQGAYNTGRIEGVLYNVNGDLSSNFTTSNVFADVGQVAVVPAPAAVILFAPMLFGLMGFGLRNRKVVN